jgi:hypothetical protein
MLVVSLALAAVLVAGSESGDAGPPPPADVPPAGTSLAAVPSNTPVTTATTEPTVAPAIPAELQGRIDTLPAKLRQEALLAYAAGALTLEQLALIVRQYENRNPNVRVGSVLGVSDGVLRFEVFTTGEPVQIAADGRTLVQRAGRDIGLEELQPGELVMVVSTDDGALAVTIDAFGVSAP